MNYTPFNKRSLIIEDSKTYLYLLDSLKDQFDEIIILTDYVKKLDDVIGYDAIKENLPPVIYDPKWKPGGESPLKTAILDKQTYVKIKDIDLGENNAYFVVGKFTWWFLRELQDCHIGLRNTNEDWQVVHLQPFTMGTNKFVFSHTMSDEFYQSNIDFFFDDEKMNKTVAKLPNAKNLRTYEELKKALVWAIERPVGTRFGLDYETNGLWKDDQYENVIPVGVGIATTKYGFYLDFRYLSPEEKEEIKVLYKEFLDKHYQNCWVFNLNFEMLITRKFLGPWSIYEFKDADIWRIIYGDQIGYSKKIVPNKYGRGNGPQFKEVKVSREQRWSLKYTAQMYLHVGSWDNEFEEIETLLGRVFNGYEFKTMEEVLMNPLVGDKIHELVENEYMTAVEATAFIKKLFTKKNVADEMSLLVCFDKEPKNWSKATGLDYPSEYSPSILFNIFKLAVFGTKDPTEIETHPEFISVVNKYPDYADEFRNLIKDPTLATNQFSVQPTEILGKYCCLDAYYTLMIAEKHLNESMFDYEKFPDRIGAKWMTTEKLVDIFNGNKSIGAKLSMYGLYKSNTIRDAYMLEQYKNRVFSNFVVGLAYYSIKLENAVTEKHPYEKLLPQIYISGLNLGLDPNDTDKLTKKLLPLVYDPDAEFGWSEVKATEVFGDLAGRVKEILLDCHPKGIVNKSAHSRAVNLHNDLGTMLAKEWEKLDLPEDFSMEDIVKQRTEILKVKDFKDVYDDLLSCSLYGKTLDEISKMNSFVFRGMNYSFEEGYLVFKKTVFDMTANNEIQLGALTERWKDYKVLLFLYSEEKYMKLIDDMKLWEPTDDLKTKVENFHKHMKNAIDKYVQPDFGSGILYDSYSVEFELLASGFHESDKQNWMVARKFARDNNFPEDLCNPDVTEFGEAVQVNAYIEAVLSEDIRRQFGASVSLFDQYTFYMGITEEEILTSKAELMDEHGVSPMAYISDALNKGQIWNIHDALAFGIKKGSDESKGVAVEDAKIATFNLYSDTAYVKMTGLFKFYRKFEKICQYLDGQLVKDDEHLIGVDEDDVPCISGMTLAEKRASKYGDDVKFFPEYQISQKFTKRNSSGIHTLPGKSQWKDCVVAPHDGLLIYTDISSLK